MARRVQGGSVAMCCLGFMRVVLNLFRLFMCSRPFLRCNEMETEFGTLGLAIGNIRMRINNLRNLCAASIA